MDLDIHLGRILTPTDLSDPAEIAIPHAAAIARWSGAELLVLHVVEKFMDHSLLYSDVWPFQKPVREYYDELTERTRERLIRHLSRRLPPEVRFRVIVATGTPSVEILATAAGEKADLIVIATHGRGGIAKALLGSTAERVLRKAECPVLTLRSGMSGFVG